MTTVLQLLIFTILTRRCLLSNQTHESGFIKLLNIFNITLRIIYYVTNILIYLLAINLSDLFSFWHAFRKTNPVDLTLLLYIKERNTLNVKCLGVLSRDKATSFELLDKRSSLPDWRTWRCRCITAISIDNTVRSPEILYGRLSGRKTRTPGSFRSYEGLDELPH